MHVNWVNVGGKLKMHWHLVGYCPNTHLYSESYSFCLSDLKYLPDKEWPTPKTPQQIFFSDLGLKRPKFLKSLMIKLKLTGEKGYFCGISGHGMFKSMKSLGHIHYACPISGLTDKQDIFQSKDEYWGSMQQNVQSFFLSLSPHICPICRHANKTYKNVAMSNRLKLNKNVI